MAELQCEQCNNTVVTSGQYVSELRAVRLDVTTDNGIDKLF